MAMPLSAAKTTYQTIQHATTDTDPNPPFIEDLNHLIVPMWASNSSHSLDLLDMVFPSDKAIIEAMIELERPWEDMHHRSYFLLELSRVENGEFILIMKGDEDWFMNPLETHVCMFRVTWKTF